MTENIVKVRAKPFAPERRSHLGAWLIAFACIAAVIAAAVGFDRYTGRLGIFAAPLDVVDSSAAGRVIKVPPGGNLQAAIDLAIGGDTIELVAGATYLGEIRLPNKRLADFVTIRSSMADSIPVDKRVAPSQAAMMAKIAAKGGGTPAVSASNGANHYRFIGIEFTSSNAEYVYNLILLGSGEQLSAVPHSIEIDRSYLHPYKSGVVRRGIALNSANTTIKNSYIEGFAFKDEETQGICGWTGTLNVHVLNNYIEGGAENIMFGGSDVSSADLIPTGIEVRDNHLNKPAAWLGKVTIKTLFELKNARKVEFSGNLLTNNWVGSALRITVRNETGGSPFNTIEDVNIIDNLIKGAGEGINILGRDDTHPSQTLKGLNIINNLFLDIGARGGFEGGGYFLQIADGEQILIANNTVFNIGNIASFYGDLPRGLVVRDNIIGHGNYGVHGLDDFKGPGQRDIFTNNVFMNLNKIPRDAFWFPIGNVIVQDASQIGFNNLSEGDYRLSQTSKFRAKGKDGKNIGSNIYPAAFAQR